jgi:hypothetical protein
MKSQCALPTIEEVNGPQGGRDADWQTAYCRSSAAHEREQMQRHPYTITHSLCGSLACLPPETLKRPGPKDCAWCWSLRRGSCWLVDSGHSLQRRARKDGLYPRTPLLQLLINNLPVIYVSCFYLPIYPVVFVSWLGGKSLSMTLSLKLAFVVRSPAVASGRK